MCQVFAVCNAKGGVGKTTTSFNLGAALSRRGHRVLLVDNDPQKANLTLALGHNAQGLRCTLSNLYCSVLDNPEELPDYIGRAVIHGAEADLIPANKRLAGIATRLSIEQSSLVDGGDVRSELVLRTITGQLRALYDEIIIDCGPKLDMLMTNALAAADRVIIPVQAHYLSEEGISDIFETVRFVREHHNPGLSVAGILLTMYQSQTKLCRGVQAQVRESYGAECHIFSQPVSWSIKVAEHPVYGESMFCLDAKHPAALAYAALAEEVLARG